MNTCKNIVIDGKLVQYQLVSVKGDCLGSRCQLSKDKNKWCNGKSECESYCVLIVDDFETVFENVNVCMKSVTEENLVILIKSSIGRTVHS